MGMGSAEGEGVAKVRTVMVSIERGVEAASKIVEVEMIGSVWLGFLSGPWCGRRLGSRGSAARGAAWIIWGSRRGRPIRRHIFVVNFPGNCGAFEEGKVSLWNGVHSCCGSNIYASLDCPLHGT